MDIDDDDDDEWAIYVEVGSDYGYYDLLKDYI